MSSTNLKPVQSSQMTIIDEDYLAMVAYYSPEKLNVVQEPKMPQEEIDVADAGASSGSDGHVAIEIPKAALSITSSERDFRAYRRCDRCTKYCFLILFVGMMVFFMCIPTIFKKKQEQVQYLTEDDKAVVPDIPGRNN